MCKCCGLLLIACRSAIPAQPCIIRPLELSGTAVDETPSINVRMSNGNVLDQVYYIKVSGIPAYLT